MQTLCALYVCPPGGGGAGAGAEQVSQFQSVEGHMPDFGLKFGYYEYMYNELDKRFKGE